MRRFELNSVMNNFLFSNIAITYSNFSFESSVFADSADEYMIATIAEKVSEGI